MDKTQLRKSVVRAIFEELTKADQFDLFCELNVIFQVDPDQTEKTLLKKVFGGLIA
jgi:hypothetical protein